MRISLNQKPNSSHDFGFQTNWDSTGAVVKSIKQGITRQMDEICFISSDILINVLSLLVLSYKLAKSYKQSISVVLNKPVWTRRF